MSAPSSTNPVEDLGIRCATCGGNIPGRTMAAGKSYHFECRPKPPEPATILIADVFRIVEAGDDSRGHFVLLKQEGAPESRLYLSSTSDVAWLSGLLYRDVKLQITETP